LGRACPAVCGADHRLGQSMTCRPYRGSTAWADPALPAEALCTDLGRACPAFRGADHRLGQSMPCLPWRSALPLPSSLRDRLPSHGSIVFRTCRSSGFPGVRYPARQVGQGDPRHVRGGRAPL
jgi:hypothetical protein